MKKIKRDKIENAYQFYKLFKIKKTIIKIKGTKYEKSTN
jgi:hypothetical protein